VLNINAIPTTAVKIRIST